jgi:transcriptional regulator with XRE-family HTH domain
MSDISKQIGQQLRARRMQLGWGVKDVAQRVGRQASRISEVETGSANSSLEALSQIGAVLGLSLIFVPDKRLPDVMAIINEQKPPARAPGIVGSVYDEVFIPDPVDGDE